MCCRWFSRLAPVPNDEQQQQQESHSFDQQTASWHVGNKEGLHRDPSETSYDWVPHINNWEIPHCLGVRLRLKLQYNDIIAI